MNQFLNDYISNIKYLHKNTSAAGKKERKTQTVIISILIICFIYTIITSILFSIETVSAITLPLVIIIYAIYEEIGAHKSLVHILYIFFFILYNFIVYKLRSMDSTFYFILYLILMNLIATLTYLTKKFLKRYHIKNFNDITIIYMFSVQLFMFAFMLKFIVPKLVD